MKKWAKAVERVRIALKIATVAVCFFFAFGGHYPPMYAQRPRIEVQQIPVLTVEDAVQDNNIKALNDHVASTDARVERQWQALNKLGNDISGMQAEGRIVEFIIGALSSAGLILQVRKKPASA